MIPDLIIDRIRSLLDALNAHERGEPRWKVLEMAGLEDPSLDDRPKPDGSLRGYVTIEAKIIENAKAALLDALKQLEGK